MSGHNADHGRMLTIAEVARHWRVHESTVRRWIDSGQVEVVRTPSGRIRLPETALRSGPPAHALPAHALAAPEKTPPDIEQSAPDSAAGNPANRG
jgi:excisionase family DNA binding protein